MSQQNVVELDVEQDNENGNLNGNEINSSKGDEQGLVDVPFVDYYSDADGETENAKDKIRKYFQLREEIEGNTGEDDAESVDEDAAENINGTEGELISKEQPDGAGIGHDRDNANTGSPRRKVS